MAIPANISLEQLAETLNKLSVSEREQLRDLLDHQWNETAEDNYAINELLSKSIEEHRQGKVRASENIINESKKKYGL